VSAAGEGAQSISSSPTRDYTEGGCPQSTLGQSSGDSPFGASPLGANHWQTSSVFFVDAAVKTELDGHLDSRRCSASLLGYKTRPADETSAPRDLTCSAAEGIVDERRHASNHTKEDGPMPYLEHLESLNKPVNWVPQADRVPQAGLSPSFEPIAEGPVRHQTTVSGGVVSPRSKKPCFSPSPNPLRKVVGIDDANQNWPDLLPGWNQMVAPPKPGRRQNRLLAAAIMACHEKAQAHMRTR